ncbi:hypothetical protein AAVH_30403 [Aphelenchoides avenae]|nr:hypothetical protein AAVH_30403 [Aphelenchus avenae]
MATERVGGAVIIPKTLASEDSLLKDIVERAHLINKPLVKGALVKIFDTVREGHDGAMIVEVVRRSQPWIHSSRVRLPYNESEHLAIIQNRGLRHNSAAYACSRTDALIIVVSEERGKISLFHRGTYNLDISKRDFAAKLGAFMSSVGT